MNANTSVYRGIIRALGAKFDQYLDVRFAASTARSCADEFRSFGNKTHMNYSDIFLMLCTWKRWMWVLPIARKLASP